VDGIIRRLVTKHEPKLSAFGFIAAGKLEFFFMPSSLDPYEPVEWADLQIGDTVTFEADANAPKGPRARDRSVRRRDAAQPQSAVA
jgi:hypothetical protein